MGVAVEAKVEGDDIVIRVPLSVMSAAIHVSGFKVVDPATFASSLVEAMNEEDEAGNTLVHRILDEAAAAAVEAGADGVEEEEDEFAD